MRLLGRIGLVQLRDQRVDLAAEAGREVEERAAPEVALLEGAQVEPGDDAQVVAAAPERDKQVRVLLAVGVDDFARGQDDFVVDDVVGDEAFARAEEREAT